MTTMIRTKWHRVIELLRDKENVYFTAPRSDGGGPIVHVLNFHQLEKARPVEDFDVDLDLMYRFFTEHIGNVPKFVIEPELLNLTIDIEFHKSIRDMAVAGVCRLPYPAMIVEYTKRSSGRGRAFALLRDLTPPLEQLPWESDTVRIMENAEAMGPNAFYAYVFELEQDVDGEYLAVAPCANYLGITNAELDKSFDDMQLGTAASAINLGDKVNYTEIDKLVAKTYVKTAVVGWKALFAALLLMSTGGVEREVIECQKLNRHRKASNKPLVPRHTYVHIKRVYHSAAGNDSDDYVPGTSKRPHWRRGHNQTVRHGVGKQLTKTVFIPGRLVAFKGEGVIPPKPTYIVTP